MTPTADSPYARKWLNERLAPLFSDTDREAVVNWVAAHRGRPKVVLIGSGFSRTARLADGVAGPLAEKVPLWPQITKLLREGLGYFEGSEGPSDPLLIAEQYQESRGREKFAEVLLSALKDEEIVPGSAHDALTDYNVEAIITTNQLDSLLDRMDGEWFRVVDSSDLPVARSLAGRTPSRPARQVIYLHGHRSAPKTWVFAREEYEAITKTRPALVRRVQQLLSEYPLLVLGYSLSDPDFHWLFSTVHSEQEGFMPRALCLTVGSAPRAAERAHWRRMGMHLAHLEGGHSENAGSTELQASSGSAGDALAYFLRLETGGPHPKAIAEWLESLVEPTLDGTLARRLKEFDLALGEIKARAGTSGEGAEKWSPGKALFSCWRSCLPTYPSTAQLQVVDLPEQRAAPTARAYPHLFEGVEKFATGEGRNLLDGCESFLAAGGQPALLGDWLVLANRWRIRPRQQRSLGDSFDDALRMVSPLFVENQPKGRHAAPAEGLMKSGQAAAFAAQWKECAAYYLQAAEHFEQRGDDIGAWRARVSRCGALVAPTNMVVDGQDDWSEYQLEQNRVRRLESTPDVIDWSARRQRILHAAYKERASKAERRESPGRHETHFSVASEELRGLLEEEQFAGTLPSQLQEMAALFLSLEGGDDLDSLQLGLRYEVTELGTLVGVQDERILQAQRDRDEHFTRRLIGCLDPANREMTRLPQLVPVVAQILPRIVHRLDQGAVNQLRSWILGAWERAPDAFFETAFSTTTVGIMAKPFAELLSYSDSDSGSEVVSSLERVGAPELRDKVGGLDFWQSLANGFWGGPLSLGDVTLRDLLLWHLDNKPGSGGEEWAGREWRRSLLNLVRNARGLGLPIDDDLFDRLQQEAAELPPGSPEEFDFLRAVGDVGALLEQLPGRSLEWPLPSRLLVSESLWGSGVRKIDPSSAFARKLSSEGANALEKGLDERRYGAFEQTYQLVSVCLALGLGDRDKQRDWLLEHAAEHERVPLVCLSWSMRAGRWEGARSAPFRTVLTLPGGPIRDHHVIRLFGDLLGEHPRTDTQICVADLRDATFLAQRSVDSSEESTATSAVTVLVRLLARLPSTWPDETELLSRVWATLTRCAKHPRSSVRAQLGFELAALKHPVLHEALVEFPIEEGVEELAKDYSAVVVAYTRFGRALSRVEEKNPE